MEWQQDPVAEARTPSRTTARLLACALLACAGMPQLASAASDVVIDCDRLASNLRSLEVTTDELPLEAAAHLAQDDPEAIAESLETPDTAPEAAAPVLRLTPRVADIMRDVFSTLPGKKGESAGDQAEESQAAPVVQTPTGEVETAPRDIAESNGVLPNIQRRMYRTDI